MVTYCKQDVTVTAELYRRLDRDLKDFGRSVELEHQVAVLMKRQENNGFKLNVPEAVSLLAELKDRMSVITDEMQAIFPPIVEERWSEKTGKQLKDKVTVFNVGVVNRLLNVFILLVQSSRRRLRRDQSSLMNLCWQGLICQRHR
jgi:DNA polymerase I